MRAARLDAMEQYILQNGQVSISHLQKRFGISINTLRRDLNELEKRGHVSKIYGGVASLTLSSLLTMPERFQLNLTEKRTIGELAASIIPDNATVFIDSGSTTKNVVRYLGHHKGLTIVSHSLVVLNEATSLQEVNLISPGGIYNPSIGAFVGLSVLDTIRKLSVQVAVMAATGVSVDHGLTNTTYFEAEIKRAVTSNCECIVLLADHTKFNHNALISYCPLEKVSTVVTDVKPPPQYMNFFRKHDIQVLYEQCCPPSSPATDKAVR